MPEHAAPVPDLPWTAYRDREGDWEVRGVENWWVVMPNLGLSHAQQAAVTRLAAAAPDLYAALRALLSAPLRLSQSWDSVTATTMMDAIAAAEAALAKADGEGEPA